MLTTLRQRERRDGIVLKTISFPVPPPSHGRPVSALRSRGHAADEADPGLPHHQPHRADLPGQADLPDGARARHPGDRGRRARLRHFPFKRRRSGVRLLRHEPAQVDCYAPIGTGFLYVRKTRIAEHVAADGGRCRAGRRHPQVRGDRHAPGGEAQRDQPRRWCSTRTSGSTGRRRACATCATAGRIACTKNPKCKTLHSEDPAQSCGIGFLAFNGVDAGKIRETLMREVRDRDGLRAARGVHGPAHHAERLHDAARDRLLC